MWLIIFFLFSTAFMAFGQTPRYWVPGGDGNWGSTNNWSTASGGVSGASVPNANTFLAIFDANSGSPNVAVNIASFNLEQLWITGNQNVTFTSSGAARTITIGDAVNNSIPGASVGNADFVIESGSTLNITGQSVANTMTVTENNSANSQVIIIGIVQVNANGILTKAANAPVTFNAGATYNHARDGGVVVTAAWNISSTCNINGTAAIAPTGLNQTFGNLNFNCTGLTAAVTMATGGAMTVQGNLSVTGTSATFTCTLDPAANAITVTGTTIVNSYGIITDSNVGGVNTFTGLVTIGVNGTWNNSSNSAVTFQGGITNNGTFTSGAGVQTFNTNNQTLTGTFSIPSVTVTGITLTNNNSLTVNTALGGTGGLTQAANSTLNIGFTGAMGITTLTADANGNTVNYNFAGVQTIKSPAVTYYNLLLGNSGVKTLAAATTINGAITVSGTATFADGSFLITGASGQTFTLGAGTTYTSTKITDPCFPTNMTYASK